MKKISEETISLLKSYFALKVIAEMETETYNRVVDEILARNRFKVDLTKIENPDFWTEHYDENSVILSYADDALYLLMSDRDLQKLKDEEIAAGIMNKDETSVYLCTESSMRDTLYLFIKSCLHDVELKDMLDGALSLEHFEKLKELCIKMVVSYCKAKKINLKMAA